MGPRPSSARYDPIVGMLHNDAEMKQSIKEPCKFEQETSRLLIFPDIVNNKT